LAVCVTFWQCKEEQPTLTVKLCGETFCSIYITWATNYNNGKSAQLYYYTMVAHWDQKKVIQQVKDQYLPDEEVLQASYDRLLPVIKDKIAEIQRTGSKVCPNSSHVHTYYNSFH
jgi:hypothetical protein